MGTSPYTFVIEEIASGGMRVELAGSDRPTGMARGTSIFESGTTLNKETVRLVGRDLPLYQVKQTEQPPLIVKGAFRDNLFIRDGGAVGTMHARDMRDRLNLLASRAKPVRVTWAGETRTGILDKARFGEEGEHDITYELTFEIAQGVQPSNTRSQTSSQSQNRRDASDVIDQLRQMIATRRAQIEAMRTMQVVRSVADMVENGIDLADTALSSAQAQSAALELSTTGALFGNVTRTINAITVAQASCAAAKALLLATPASAAFTRPTADATAAYWQAQYGTASDLDAVTAQLQQIAADARARVQSATVLYTVRPGDTLQSIARDTLGDASRANELGVRADQVVPGAVIRIPEAA